MPIFSIQQDKLARLKEKNFDLEKEMQKTVELNLKEIFDLEFVKSEVVLGNFRMDTLAFDNNSKCFVIIEYKNDKNFSVIDQGYAYLALLLNNKAEFILEYNESKNKNMKRDDVDWSQSRIIFISPQFTLYQRQAVNFKDLPIELWEISKYENNTILFNQLKSPDVSESITTISQKSDIVQKVSREIKLYTEEYHFEGIPDDIKELYGELKGRILNISNEIKIRPRKDYIGFITDTNFVDIHLQQHKIKLWVNLKKGELDDPKKLARDVSKKGHWGNGDFEIYIQIEDDIDYLMTLIKQSFKKHSS